MDNGDDDWGEEKGGGSAGDGNLLSVPCVVRVVWFVITADHVVVVVGCASDATTTETV